MKNKDEEIGSGSLPHGWADVMVAEAFVDVRNGTTTTQNKERIGLPVSRIESVQSGKFVPHRLGYIESDKDLSSFKYEVGDLAFSHINSLEHVGKVAIFGGTPEGLLHGMNLLRLRPDLRIADAKFMFYQMGSQDVRTQIRAGIHMSVNQVSINQQRLSTVALVLPPLPEQGRIVAEIERLFSLLEAGVANLKRVQANLKRYRASVLQAACTGKLVPTEVELARAEGREYEPADVLLQRILVERRARWEAEQLAKMRAAGKDPKDDKWKAKYEEPATPDPRDLPELPQGWVWAKVEQISSAVRYGSSAKTSEDATGVPVLRMGNIQGGRLDWGELKYLPSRHAEFPDLFLQAGDILFNRTNSAELVGKSAVYKGGVTPASYASYLISVRLITGSLPELFCFFINSAAGRKWVASVVTQQVGQANVNGTKLQALDFPLPPIAEQERIVAEVERRLSVVDALETTVKQNLKRAERLRQAILRDAFAGKLVPQDPADEPASVLLARIEDERANTTNKKQNTKLKK